MSLNTYGGTFVGFKAIREGGIKKEVQVQKADKTQYPNLDEKPDKVIVTLVGVENLKLPEVEPPSKRELVVTAIFDEDSIEEMVLPCNDKEMLSLYLSCITTSFLEDGTKRVEFKGHAYTKTIVLSKCADQKQIKEELKLSDETAVPGVRLTFRIVTTKNNLGPEVPEDKIASVLDKYKQK